ncbi:MAG: hypothetical protein E3J35_06890 [Methanomassiliicoccales archaeon]|nr:MAG: hypothetical protein E3J35_06890 [Methanomassiliicoccales archaeon]
MGSQYGKKPKSKKHVISRLPPVVRIFWNSKIRKYFRTEKTSYLKFGDVQYVMCRRKPKWKKWTNRWEGYFPLVDGLTGFEVYNTKEHLFQDLKKLSSTDHPNQKPEEHPPPPLIHSKSKGYKLSKYALSSYMAKDYVLSRLSECPAVADYRDIFYFGLDLNLLIARQGNLEREVHKHLEKLSGAKKALRKLWVHQNLTEFVDRFRTVWGSIEEEDKGYFYNHVLNQMRSFIRISGQEEGEFKEYLSRIQAVFKESEVRRGRDAKDYERNIDRITSAHKEEIRTYMQEQWLVDVTPYSHFIIAKTAIKCMVMDELLSDEDANWLLVQQRMSELYDDKFGDRLSSSVAERCPLVVIDPALGWSD